MFVVEHIHWVGVMAKSCNRAAAPRRDPTLWGSLRTRCHQGGTASAVEEHPHAKHSGQSWGEERCSPALHLSLAHSQNQQPAPLLLLQPYKARKITTSKIPTQVKCSAPASQFAAGGLWDPALAKSCPGCRGAVGAEWEGKRGGR